MSASKPLFSAHNIACDRGGRVLFQNLSFDVKAGEVVHLSGSNGAGKTSFLRIVAGALSPRLGKLYFEDVEFSDNTFAAEGAFLPADDNALKVLETVVENLSFWAKLWGVPLKNIDQALKAMQLQDLKNHHVRVLSAGQKRRLSIARALMKPSRLLLLDEPLNALDATAQKLLAGALDAYQGAVIVAGHNPLPGWREVKVA